MHLHLVTFLFITYSFIGWLCMMIISLTSMLKISSFMVLSKTPLVKDIGFLLVKYRDCQVSFLQSGPPDFFCPGPEVIKHFSCSPQLKMKILNAHKYKNIRKFSGFFSGSDKPIMLFFLLIKIQMPTIVGILTFISRKNFMLN